VRAHQLRLDHVIVRIKKLQALERQIERALIKEYENIPGDENVAVDYERLMGPDEDNGDVLQNPEIRELLAGLVDKVK
jgi:hypothetical protein